MSEALSDRKLAANRRNASLSTGPRTPRGKAIAAANALQHGLFAKDLLLPGENADELLQLKTRFLRRLNPRDELELELVQRVIASAWKLRRLQRFEALLYQRECQALDVVPRSTRESVGLGRHEAVPAEIAWRGAGPALHAQLERLAVQEHRLEAALHRSLKQLAALRKEEIDEPLTEFAAQAVADEERANPKWQSEATALRQKCDQARLDEAREERERRRDRRAAEAAEKESGEWDEEDEYGFDDDDSQNWESEATEPPAAATETGCATANPNESTLDR